MSETSRKRRVEEGIRGQANSSQKGKDETPERVMYGEGEPSVTGGSGEDELLGWIQRQLSQDKGTGAVRPEGARGSSANITICLELKEYDTGFFRHLFGSPVSGVIYSGSRATMDEINRTSGRTLGRVVPFQRHDRSLSCSERTLRAIVPTGPARGGTASKSRVVDIRKNLAVRNSFVQVAAEHP